MIPFESRRPPMGRLRMIPFDRLRMIPFDRLRMIPGVELHQLTQHPMGERGYWFQEQGRFSDPLFAEGVAQWSRAKMHTGCIKAWHIHQKQVDWWFVESGLIKAVLVDLRGDDALVKHYLTGKPVEVENYNPCEFFLGDDQPPGILKIPPGVAHGLKVLQGPAVLSYLTSREYDPTDEGRIPFDALGYDWDKRDIR